MNVIVCLDEAGGMAFNGRRQSRDRAVAEDLLCYIGSQSLWMAPASRKLFPEDCANIHCSADYLNSAAAEDWCFVETESVLPHKERIRTLMLYHWGRSYPGDLQFPKELLEHRQLTDRKEFPGSSHACICREVYTL